MSKKAAKNKPRKVKKPPLRTPRWVLPLAAVLLGGAYVWGFSESGLLSVRQGSRLWQRGVSAVGRTAEAWKRAALAFWQAGPATTAVAAADQPVVVEDVQMPPQPEAPAETAVDPAGEDGRLREVERRAFEMEMENIHLRSQLDDMGNWILDNVQGRYPLQEKLMARLVIDPLTDDLFVSDDLATLLRLNEEETQRMDSYFLDSRGALYELEALNISVEQLADNQYLLTIPPYDDTGGTIREKLYEQLAGILGTARFNRFLQVAEGSLNERYDYFGNMFRTLTFEAFDENGTTQWFIRDEKAVPSGDPLRQDVIVSELLVDEVPEEYLAYEAWMLEAAGVK